MFTLVEPSDGLTFLKRSDSGDVVYSNAHIAKVWTLEATALADARQALINVQAGKELKDAFAGLTADQIKQIIQEHLSNEDTTGAGRVDEGVPPATAGAQQDDVLGVPSRRRQPAERDEYICELEQQLADVQKQLIAQRTLAATPDGSSDWEEKYSEVHKRAYWSNKKTGERTWTKPVAGGAAASPRLVAAGGAAATGGSSDWAEKYSDEHKRAYWSNKKTGERTWTKPVAAMDSSR
jgi:hypothetical protein